jgi:transposase
MTHGTWREDAQALRAADATLSYSEIARRVGVTSPTVWKLFNKERALESDRRTRDKRRVRRREIDREYSARKRSVCTTCGQHCGIGTGKKSHQPEQCRDCFLAAVDAKRDEIRRLWLAGQTMRQIAEAIGTTTNSLGVMMVRMRESGWDLPYRRLAVTSGLTDKTPGNQSGPASVAPDRDRGNQERGS